jgi:hypothetical protein
VLRLELEQAPIVRFEAETAEDVERLCAWLPRAAAVGDLPRVVRDAVSTLEAA